MPVVDARGRLFGAINLIDLGALLFVALLIPLGYGAYFLFHMPLPRLIAVEPSSLSVARGTEQRVRITGRYLRPFLRAKLGSATASAYTLLTRDAAEIRFGDLPPGTYDIVLLDESQEVARLAAGLTIVPLPIQIIGWFVGAAAGNDRIVAGVKLGDAAHPTGEVLELEPAATAGRRLATLRVTCRLSTGNECLIGSAAAHAGSELNLTLAGSSDPAPFLVRELRVDQHWVDVKVRLMGLPEALALTAPGDIDGRPEEPTSTQMSGVISGAIIRSVGERQKHQGSFALTTTQPTSTVRDLTTYGVLSAVLSVDTQDAELAIPTESSRLALMYRDVPIRPGSVIGFETGRYRIQVLIASVPKSGR
jgi:hypothetical protein